MNGFKMLTKKRRERICKQAIEQATRKWKLDDLVKMCDEHTDENPLLEDFKNILTGTDIKITGVGYTDDCNEVLFKIEMVINRKSVTSLNKVVKEFEPYFVD